MPIILGVVAITLLVTGFGMLSVVATPYFVGGAICLALGTALAVTAMTFWFEPDDMP